MFGAFLLPLSRECCAPGADRETLHLAWGDRGEEGNVLYPLAADASEYEFEPKRHFFSYLFLITSFKEVTDLYIKIFAESPELLPL